MKTLTAVGFVMVAASLFVSTEATVSCSLKMDLAFLIDASSSIGADNFALLREFCINIVDELDIGPEMTRVTMARYNYWVNSAFYFNSFTTKTEVTNAIRRIPYFGRGTRTANALKVLTDRHLQESKGWRGNEAPTVVILVTDGKAKDAADIPAAVRKLHANASKVITVGVGNADPVELDRIATRPLDENNIYISEFRGIIASLPGIVDNVCVTGDDVNECKEHNGGCKTYCINTTGSFYCDCDEGYQIGTDGLTCNAAA